MRRQLAIASAASAFALLAGCAIAPKLPAIPPPIDAAPPTAGAQPGPTTWYQPFMSDGSAMEEKRFGMGLLKATYRITDEQVSMKTKVDFADPGPTLLVNPLKADLLAPFFTMGPAFFGFAWGETPLSFGSGPSYQVKTFGLYEGVRVPITLADFKGPDVQLLLIPGMTMQVLVMNGSLSGGTKVSGVMIGGSLNAVGVGVSVGDWLVLEADFVKWGWNYFIDLTLDLPDGTSIAGSFSDFEYGFAPVFFARVKF